MTMALLTGFLPLSLQGGLVNPQLSRDLDAFAGIVGWPVGESLIAPGAIQPLTTAWPVEAGGRVLSGTTAHAYSDDFYHRLHIAPVQLDLGNVVSTQTSDVTVWNAYFEPRTLTALDGLEAGLQATGQLTPPLLFNALQERTWQVSVTPDGSPVLEASLVWTFDNGDAPGLRITATRIIAWAFAPDWADGVTETLTWATDILQSESGVEQRRAIRLAPRRELAAPLYVEGRERQLLDLALFGWGARIWALPIWPDIQLLDADVPAGSTFIACQTAGLDFVAGGLALLRGEHAGQSETVEVQAVQVDGLQLKRTTQQAWPAGSRLYPARAAQLVEAPSLTRLTDTVQSAEVRFLLMEPSDWPAVLPTTRYRGRPVLEQRPDESEDLTANFARILTTLDNGAAIPRVTDTAGRAFPVQGHRWLGMGRAERAAYRSLLYALRGRQVPVWLPSHADDLQLRAPVSDVATTLDVANIGYSRFGKAQPGRRDIRLELWDGRVFHRRITGATELDADTERLALDATLGVTVTPAQVARISWLVLCRLDSDSIEIHHETDSEGVASSALVFRGVRDDEF
jgi:hypothetical protein